MAQRTDEALPDEVVANDARPRATVVERRRIRRRFRRLIAPAVVVIASLWLFHSEWPKLCRNRAVAAMRMQQAALATTWLERADWFGTDQPETALLQATAARLQGLNARAEEWLFEARRRHATEAAIFREEILMAAQSGRMRVAAPMLAQLLTDPTGDNRDVCVAYITGFLRTQRVDQASVLIDELIKADPESPFPWLARGRIAFMRDATAQAEADFREAMSRSPNWIEPRLRLADVLRATRRYEEAIPLYEQARGDRTFRDAAAVGLAQCRAALGQTTQAINLLTVATTEPACSSDVWLELGRLQFEDSHLDEAVAALSRVTTVQPNHEEANYLLAQCFQQLGRQDEAAACRDRVTQARKAFEELHVLQDKVQKDPANAELHLRAGELLLVWGNAEDGIASLQNALDINPQLTRASELLSNYRQQHPNP